MDPFTAIGAALSVGGFISNLFGSSQAKSLAKQQNKIASQIADNSVAINELHREAATNDYLQSQRQLIRNAQVARATALSNATNQGAQFGSGLQGGYGQISGQMGDQLATIGGEYQLGQQEFDLDNANQKLQTQYNKLGGKINLLSGQGNSLMQLGTSLVNNGAKLTNSVSGIRNVFAGL